MSMMKEQLYDRLTALAAELDTSADFVLDAYSKLDNFFEIFKFEEMKPEWIRELAHATGYEEAYLTERYTECMEDDTWPDQRNRRMDFVICTLEEDW